MKVNIFFTILLWYFSMHLIDVIYCKYIMWILIITWMSIDTTALDRGQPISKFNSEVLYSYDTKEDCEWAREWVLENNKPSQNPTTKTYCVTPLDTRLNNKD